MGKIWFDITEKLCDKLIYIFVGGRGIGKTYSAIQWAIKDFLTTGKETIYLRRMGSDIENFSHDMKIYENIAPPHIISAKNEILYIDGKPAVYAVGLNVAKRSSNFKNVNKIIYDEAIVEEGKSYLKNEFSRLVNFYETVSRLRVDEKGEVEQKTENLVTLVLLGNNSSKYNLWTSAFNIDLGGADKFTKGDIYYEILKNSDEITALREKSRFGKILQNTNEYKYMYENTDISIDYTNVRGLPPNAGAIGNISSQGYKLGIYIKDGKIYISSQIDGATDFSFDKKHFNYIGNSKIYLYMKLLKNENKIYFKNKKIADIYFNVFNPYI